MKQQLFFLFFCVYLIQCNVNVYYVHTLELSCNETISYGSENQTIFVLEELRFLPDAGESSYRRCINHFNGVFFVVNGTGLVRMVDDMTNDEMTLVFTNSTIYGNVVFQNNQHDFIQILMEDTRLFNGTWELKNINIFKMNYGFVHNHSILIQNYTIASFSGVRFTRSTVLMHHGEPKLVFSLFTAKKNAFDSFSMIYLDCTNMDINISNSLSHYLIHGMDRSDCTVSLSKMSDDK